MLIRHLTMAALTVLLGLGPAISMAADPPVTCSPGSEWTGRRCKLKARTPGQIPAPLRGLSD